MKKHNGTRYNSRWDVSTWVILVFSIAACIWPLFIEFNIAPIIIGVGMLALLLVLFLGCYYKVDGYNLVVYQFFRPTILPIDKIKEIKPTKTWLAGPATSLTHRIAITFVDRKVLKSSEPLIISPVRQTEFIRQLLSINPNILA